MKRTLRFFEVEYNYFPVGTIVTPTSSRCALEPGWYQVETFAPPLCPGDDAIITITGRKYGVSTTYLREVTPEEILGAVSSG